MLTKTTISIYWYHIFETFESLALCLVVTVVGNIGYEWLGSNRGVVAMKPAMQLTKDSYLLALGPWPLAPTLGAWHLLLRDAVLCKIFAPIPDD